ncbi:Beta-secretase 2 [Mortierella sp. GBA30]|nr:Beta-secretase 2 [Mortierella sp. GBA30]
MILRDTQSSRGNIPNPDDQEPLNLYREQVVDQHVSHPLLPTSWTSSTLSSMSTGAPSSKAYQSASYNAEMALADAATPSALTTLAAVTPSQISAIDIKAKGSFEEYRDRLKRMQSCSQGVNMAHYSSPSDTTELNITETGYRYATSTISSITQVTQACAVTRLLAAAPAENLYPLSPSREYGQAIRVSYGIKSHSVGWNGVMTSDLLTMEMAKVEPKDKTGVNAPSSPSRDVTLEKEANVEFAAILENSDFFSQECGAQHGIWGLGYRTLSVDRKPTLFDTLSASMKIPNGFALQLCGRTSNTSKSGNMFLGGYSTAHLAGPMQFVPLVKKDWYQVRLDGFKVMGEPVKGMQNLNLPKTIIDSGTTNILMSHYNLQFFIQSLAHSQVVRWSSLIPDEDIGNFWFRNAVLRLPRSSFQVSTAARAVEVVISGVSIPIYTSSFLRIKPVPAGQAPDGYVDFWWHGFASSTSPDAIEAEHASGGAVMPGSVGTILGETLFAGKVVYFERGQEEAQAGDPDFGRIGFGRGKNCFAPADHASVDVLASDGKFVKLEGLGPVRVAVTSDARATKKTGGDSGSTSDDGHAQPSTSSPPLPHFPGLSGPIRLMGSASHSLKGLGRGMICRVASGLLVAAVAILV